MEEFRDITFRDGPTGRRAALIGGPDIWEVMFTLKSGKARAKAITATAELLNLTDSQVQTAARYYGTFPDEIGRRIALNTADADGSKRLGSAVRQPRPETPPRQGDQWQGRA